MSTMQDPFRSARLLYRAVEPDQDEAFFLRVQQDPIAWVNSNISYPRPQGKRDATKYIQALEDALLGVVICLLPETAPQSLNDSNKDGTSVSVPGSADVNATLDKSISDPDTVKVTPVPIPIGAINLKKLPVGMSHHRMTEIGIDIIRPYQNQGYGTEAIRWILTYAFDSLNLHRVNIRGFTYNAPALRLYERIGFVKEGVSREAVWYRGEYWDDVQLGILDREWRAMRDQAHPFPLTRPPLPSSTYNDDGNKN